MSADETDNIILGSGTNSWVPAVGDATTALGRLLVDNRKELPDHATFDGIVKSSLGIIKECKPFDSATGRRTGLVIGYVQSGKTMSMATVASLARDNGCRIVILLAGVTEILLQQTARKRFRPYLTNQPDARRGWQVRDTVDAPDITNFRQDLTSWVKEWKRPDVPEARKRPLFVAVMKQHVHLSNLRDALHAVDLTGVPALILDDEADQASLDNNASKNTSEPSTTYDRIAGIRAGLPNHTYLQYTATPQAPLLISLADMLSPDFAQILKPGKGYTGGKAFFIDRRELVAEIKEEDLTEPKTPPTEPPDTLLKAMREFFVGAAAGYLNGADGKRSMLVHPSQSRDDHEAFNTLVLQNKSSWFEELRSEDAIIREAIADDFKEAYDELLKTLPDLPGFSELLEELPYVMSDTRVWKVNSDDGREVDWDASYSHILIGGDKLNRGFTVEGLTVTFMPRKPGGWNADTIQQRARFFGYKEKYLGLCRVYLHPEVRDAFTEYVEHEEDLRRQLSDFAGRPLKEWKRRFLMDHRMKPTRTNVLSESITKPKLEGWFRQNWPHADLKAADDNQKRIDSFISSVSTSAVFNRVNDKVSHTEAVVPLRKVLDELLIEYEMFGADALSWTEVLLWLSALVQSPKPPSCNVVRIRDGKRRERAESDVEGRISNLFQGRDPRTGERADEEMRDKTMVTLQIHELTLTRNKKAFAEAPAIALHFPANFKPKDVMYQDKAGQAP